MFLTGALMLMAALTYGVVSQNDPPLRIYFPNDVLRPTFNYSFYLTLFTGLLTVVLATVVVVMDIFYPRKIATFFHHALIEDDNIFEVHVTQCNVMYLRNMLHAYRIVMLNFHDISASNRATASVLMTCMHPQLGPPN